jgi:hypothetical protein
VDFFDVVGKAARRRRFERRQRRERRRSEEALAERTIAGKGAGRVLDRVRSRVRPTRAAGTGRRILPILREFTLLFCTVDVHSAVRMRCMVCRPDHLAVVVVRGLLFLRATR